MRSARLTRVILAAGLVPAAGMLALSVTASATVPDTVAVYGSAAKAAGIHMIAGTSQFPNWDPGAVDNRYPLAAVGSDAGPSTHAAASAADYGPAAATVAASDPPQPFCTPPAPPSLCTPTTTIPHNPPPDVYALAQYPTPPGKPEDHYSNGASDRADAYARELQADANGTYAGTTGSPFSQATAETHTIVNPDGSIHVFTHSHVQSASFGPVVIRDVDVKTDVVSKNGKAASTATINAGTVQNGSDKPTEVTTKDQTIAIPGADGLPITFRVFAVKPQDDTKGATGSIFATGTHVVIDQPVVQNQFSHHVEYVLGEGFSQAYLVPATPLGSSGGSSSNTSTDTGFATDSGGTTTTTITNPGLDSSFTGAAPSVVTANAHKAAPKTKQRRVALAAGRIPMPLAAMFFLWEALVLGAAASAVWARRAMTVPK